MHPTTCIRLSSSKGMGEGGITEMKINAQSTTHISNHKVFLRKGRGGGILLIFLFCKGLMKNERKYDMAQLAYNSMIHSKIQRRGKYFIFLLLKTPQGVENEKRSNIS